ncbi:MULTISPECIES: PHP domain-containing protein [unclassified Clostridium]|uniref:PHP domain-containing protein n=1 Tax=unclassified Clostridium TaxID=2614128 RepID=UPI0002976195|nr:MULTISPECIES: PHP domain-containing protein [unclassified Clostridium]EKQ56432.1 MAG: putative metal-dependent phosphoesterase, PHP family [Clostridium sp. Maddingley MBC34-26]
MYKKGDFHVHSTFSDGGCTPKEIVMISKRRNVDIIALTDHNNTCGIDEAIAAGKEIGVKVIPGVELSTRYNNCRVHVLGYFKDDSYKNELLIEVLKNIKSHRLSAIKHLLGKFIDFYDKKDRLHVETGIEILKFFGATVILAHPVLLNRKDFHEIIKMNFDGLEAKYFSNNTEDTEYFLNVAKDRNLLYTAGSDFHSTNELYRTHGMIGDVYLSEQEIYNFLVGGNLLYV